MELRYYPLELVNLQAFEGRFQAVRKGVKVRFRHVGFVR